MVPHIHQCGRTTVISDKQDTMLHWIVHGAPPTLTSHRIQIDLRVTAFKVLQRALAIHRSGVNQVMLVRMEFHIGNAPMSHAHSSNPWAVFSWLGVGPQDHITSMCAIGHSFWVEGVPTEACHTPGEAAVDVCNTPVGTGVFQAPPQASTGFPGVKFTWLCAQFDRIQYFHQVLWDLIHCVVQKWTKMKTTRGSIRGRTHLSFHVIKKKLSMT